MTVPGTAGGLRSTIKHYPAALSVEVHDFQLHAGNLLIVFDIVLLSGI